MAVLTWLALAGASYLLLGKRAAARASAVNDAAGAPVAAFTAESRALAVRRLEAGHLVSVDAGDDPRVVAAYTVEPGPGAAGEPSALSVLEQHFDAGESVLAELGILSADEPSPVVLAVSGDALSEYAAPGSGWLVLGSPVVPVVRRTAPPGGEALGATE